MSGQTNTYRWLPWAVVAAIVAAVGFAAYQFNLFYSTPTITPWENAQTVDTLIAIRDFGGNPHDLDQLWKAKWGALAGILLLFVIGPACWIFGEIKNGNEGAGEDELKKGFGWYVGAVVIVAGLLYAIPMTVSKGISLQNTWKSAAKSQNIDELRSALAVQAMEAVNEYFVSNSERVLPLEQDEEIILAASTALEEEVITNTNDDNTFVAALDADGSTIIYGVGYEDGKNADFINADGQQGKVQLAVRVIPESENMLEWITEGESINK